jgi:hypothetical protein
MDAAIKLTTADASAPAKASCHFMDHPLPVQSHATLQRHYGEIQGYVKFIRKTIAGFLLFLLHRASVPYGN